MDDVMVKVNDVVHIAHNASGTEQFMGALLFLGFVYYMIWIPIREKRAGRVVEGLFTRVKNDLGGLLNKLIK